MLGPATIFADDAPYRVAAALDELGVQRVLLLCGPSRRFVDRVSAALGRQRVAVFDGAKKHVPSGVVEAAAAAAEAIDAEAIVTIGGGACTGLGKALRLRTDLRFIALPTTYAGSEMTSIWGITDAGVKRTGRDDAVRPDLVIYDPALSCGMPRALSIQSLLNALAHPIAVLDSETVDSERRHLAIAAIRDAYEAAHRIVTHPRSLPARRLALQAASAAGRVLDTGALGEHHRVAHVLGGRFDLPHADLHAILLPGYVHALHERAPAIFETIVAATGDPDPSATLHDLLLRVDAPTSLADLRIDATVATEAVREAGIDDAVPWVRAVAVGRRLSIRTRYAAWLDAAPPVSIRGAELAAARRIVLAIHGRGSHADAIARRAAEIVGDDPSTCIVAPQADGSAWYPRPYHESLLDHGEVVDAAIARIDAVFERIVREVPGVPIVVLGFSQGACLALSWAMRTEHRPAAVIAIAGAAIGTGDEWAPPPAMRGVPMLLGAAEHDPWIRLTDVRATARHFAVAGANVETMLVPGAAHEIARVQRIRARELTLVRDDRAGQHGFGNAHLSQAWPDVVPRSQNTPRRPAHGLYSEQINGTGFVAPREINRRTWMYRVRPSAGRPPMRALPHPTLRADFVGRPPQIDLTAHRALPVPSVPTDFIDGLHTYGGAGDPSLRRGFAIHLYAADRSMEHRAFYNADGELLILPQHGRLALQTELGVLDVAPGQIAIVPRGVVFSVLLYEPFARGFVGETFGRAFVLPERGPVGANALTDARHFRAPTAWPEDRLDPGFRITAKLGGHLFETRIDHSPFDVVGWHGTHTPYVYDLGDFLPLSAVRRDHADPSIYTVLSAPLDEAGSHALDLIVFVPRWDATEGTFRPPFFHRNAITEVNGIIRERERADSPFHAGMCFLTPSMTPHGVVAGTYDRTVALDDAQADRPARLADFPLWFQLESALPLALTPWAQAAPERIRDWDTVWGRYRTYFDPARRDPF